MHSSLSPLDVNKMTNELNNVKTEVDKQLVEIKVTLDKAFNGLDVDSPGTSWAQVASEHVERKLVMVAAEVEEVNQTSRYISLNLSLFTQNQHTCTSFGKLYSHRILSRTARWRTTLTAVFK